MGGDGVPRDFDRTHSDRREARRPVRSEAVPSRRNDRICHRLGPLRPVSEHGRAHRVPCAAGNFRWRSVRERVRHHRRPLLTRPACEAPRRLRRDLRHRFGRRPGRRRVSDRQPDVALGLLCERPGRVARHRRRVRHSSDGPARRVVARYRLRRRVHARGVDRAPPHRAVHHARPRLHLPRGARAPAHRRGDGRDLLHRRATHGSPRRPVRSLEEPDVLGVYRYRIPARFRDVRRDSLRGPRVPGRPRHARDEFGPAYHAPHGRSYRLEHHHGPAHGPDQAVPLHRDRRRRDSEHRPLPAGAGDRRYA